MVSLVGAFAAVLAEVPVAGEDLAARQTDTRAGALDAVLQLDDRRCSQHLRGRADLGVVVLDDLRLRTEDEPERPAQIADVEWLVVGVQKKDDAIQRIPRVGVSSHAALGIVTHHARSPLHEASRRQYQFPTRGHGGLVSPDRTRPVPAARDHGTTG